MGDRSLSSSAETMLWGGESIGAQNHLYLASFAFGFAGFFDAGGLSVADGGELV